MELNITIKVILLCNAVITLFHFELNQLRQFIIIINHLVPFNFGNLYMSFNENEKLGQINRKLLISNSQKMNSI